MLHRRGSSPIVLLPVRTPLIKQGESLNQKLAEALTKTRISLRKGDILALASKVVSVAERRIVNLDEIEVTAEARRIATRWRIDRKLAAVVLEEADVIIGGVHGFLLTVKRGILTANAGVDLKNTPEGTAICWPKNPDKSAGSIRRFYEKKLAIRMGVIVVDSRVTPLRLGTVGIAIGLSGVSPVRDSRGISDLYGRETRITRQNIVDDLASAAHLLMGETKEQIGAVVIRNAPVVFEGRATSRTAHISARQCLIASNLKRT